MAENKIEQKAGDNSQQVQAGTVNITNYYGMTEERVKEIFSELQAISLKDNILAGEEIANERLQKFSELVLPRIEKIEKDFASFSDPSFQILLKKAQITSACSEREIDNHLLSELIAHRINNKTNIKKKTSIEKSVEIVDKIDDDALCGLTMFHAITQFAPNSGSITEGLSILDNLYSKCQYINLPTGLDWIDNLDVLGAIRINTFGKLKKFDEFLADCCSGYVCVGIKKDSQQYIECCNKLNQIGLDEHLFIENELLEGYIRLPITNKNYIEELSCHVLLKENEFTKRILVPLSQNQKQGLYNIYNSYIKDQTLLKQVENNFKEKLVTFPHLKKVNEWFNSITISFRVTSIGKAIAQSNVKRIDPSIPDID